MAALRGIQLSEHNLHLISSTILATKKINSEVDKLKVVKGWVAGVIAFVGHAIFGAAA